MVKMFDVDTGEELVLLDEERGDVRCACLSPDGKLIVSGGKVCDVTTGEVKVSLTEHLTPKLITFVATSMAFSPDSKRIVAGFSALNGIYGGKRFYPPLTGSG